MRHLCFALVLLTFFSVHAQKVQKSPLQVGDLAQALGNFDALELSLPPGSRSYILASPGARLSGSIEGGGKRLVAGVSSFALQTCQDEGKIGVFIAFANTASSWSCVDQPVNSLTPAFRAVRLPDSQKSEVVLALNRWFPLWAYIPNLRAFSNGVEVSSPAGWLLWQIYLSDQELVNLKEVPDPPQYVSGQITLF